MKNVKPISINGNININALLAEGKKVRLVGLSGKTIMAATVSGNILLFQNGEQLFAIGTDNDKTIRETDKYTLTINKDWVEVRRHGYDDIMDDVMKEGNRVLDELFGDIFKGLR